MSLKQDLIVDMSWSSAGVSDAVLVNGARGTAAPSHYKVSGTYSSGYRLTAVCVVMGTRASAKGLKTAQAIIKRYAYIYLPVSFCSLVCIMMEASNHLCQSQSRLLKHGLNIVIILGSISMYSSWVRWFPNVGCHDIGCPPPVLYNSGTGK